MGRISKELINMRDSDIYDIIIDEYNKYGMDYLWTKKDGTEIKLGDMETSHIKSCINMLNNSIFKKITTYAYIDIFEDVILKRRELKIKKILNNVCKY